MKRIFPYIKELINLALPIILGNLCIMLISVGDVYVAARYSTNALAATSIANAILFTIYLLGFGILTSVSPILSNLRGEKKNVKKYFLPTINFSIILSLIAAIAIILSIPLIDKLGFEKHLIYDIKSYMHICAYSVFGMYVFTAVKEFLQAFEVVLLPNIINFIGVILNIFLNFILTFGWLGFPEMGCRGLAVATLISRLLVAIILVIYCVVKLRIDTQIESKNYYTQILKVGIPITLAIFFENLAFNVITILSGRISGIYAAAQNLMLTLVNFSFMIPLAISTAITIKVGYANGARNYTEMKKYIIAGTSISVVFMSICAFCYFTIPNQIISFFTPDKVLINVCHPILYLVGIFEIFDGIQVSLGGAFKGMKKTLIVMLGDFSAYWLIGLPIGYYFAIQKDLKLFGFWIGIASALVLLGIIFLCIMTILTKNLKTEQ